MFDYFIGDLKCPACGTANTVDSLTNMQTHLRGDADGSGLRVGYVFDPSDLKTTNIVGAGYALISPPREDGPIRLLEVWSCPACRTEQWGMVEITDGRITKIEAVTMNRAAFEAANFISAVNADFLAEELTGVTQSEIAEKRLNSVDILRNALV